MEYRSNWDLNSVSVRFLEMVEAKMIISAPVFEYLKPTIFFMRLFGLAPVSYQQVKKYYIVERSKKFTVYSYIFGIILSKDNGSKFHTQSKMT